MVFFERECIFASSRAIGSIRTIRNPRNLNLNLRTEIIWRRTSAIVKIYLFMVYWPFGGYPNQSMGNFQGSPSWSTQDSTFCLSNSALSKSLLSFSVICFVTVCCQMTYVKRGRWLKWSIRWLGTEHWVVPRNSSHLFVS